MAFQFKPIRVTISGTSFGGAEVWSTGFYFGKIDADMTTVPVGMSGLIAARWKTFFENVNTQVGNGWKTSQVKSALLNIDGSTNQDSIDYASISPVATGAVTVQFPPQCALVVTLSSQIQRGLGAKGRMFLPGICSPVDATGKISTANTSSISTQLKTFFDGVNTDLGAEGKIILASKGRGGLTPAPGKNAYVTGIRLGNVYDTQRRRRNALVETYSTQTLAGSF